MQENKIYSVAQAHRPNRSGGPLYPVGPGQYFKCWAPGETGPGTIISREQIGDALNAGKEVIWISHRCSFCGGETPCLRDD